MGPRFTDPEDLVSALLGRARGGRAVIAVTGPPGAGKSTFADALRDRLNARSQGMAEVLPMDGYHFDDLLLNARGWRPRKGAPHTFDVGGLRAMLERLRANQEDEIAVPVLDRTLEIARAGARVIPRSVSIVIVEGNYLLLDRPPWTALAPLFDLTVMLHAPLEVLRARLLDRWTGIGLAGAALAAKMDGNDLPNLALVHAHSRPPTTRSMQPGPGGTRGQDGHEPRPWSAPPRSSLEGVSNAGRWLNSAKGF